MNRGQLIDECVRENMSLDMMRDVVTVANVVEAIGYHPPAEYALTGTDKVSAIREAFKAKTAQEHMKWVGRRTDKSGPEWMV